MILKCIVTRCNDQYINPAINIPPYLFLFFVRYSTITIYTYNLTRKPNVKNIL